MHSYKSTIHVHDAAPCQHYKVVQNSIEVTKLDGPCTSPDMNPTIDGDVMIELIKEVWEK